MIRFIISALLLLPLSVTAQKYIDKSREYVKNELKKYVAENKTFKPKLAEKGQSLTLIVNDPSAQQAEFTYQFDETSGLCNLQKTSSSCDSCYKKYLQNLLDQKEYQWKKINESQYISRFSDYLLIEMQTEDNKQSFTLIKTQWTKELYDLMQKN